jgi:hypothetical protein
VEQRGHGHPEDRRRELGRPEQVRQRHLGTRGQCYDSESICQKHA